MQTVSCKTSIRSRSEERRIVLARMRTSNGSVALCMNLFVLTSAMSVISIMPLTAASASSLALNLSPRARVKMREINFRAPRAIASYPETPAIAMPDCRKICQ